MEKIIAIGVRRHLDELVFEAEGVRFDQLDADPLYESGTIEIIRDENTIDRMSIWEYGGHGACTCFIGKTCSPHIVPSSFQEGDTLILKFPCKHDFDFPNFIRKCYFDLRTMLRVFQHTSSGTMDQICAAFSKQAFEDGKEYREPDVLRFSQVS